MPKLTPLLQLQRLVSSVPPDKFAMDRICRPHRTGPIRDPIGWMAVDRWFQVNTPIGGVLNPKCELIGQQDNGRDTVFTAVTGIFGLTMRDTTVLFAYSGQAKVRFSYEGVPTTFEPRDITRQDFLDNLARVIRGEAPKPYELLWRERVQVARSATVGELGTPAARKIQSSV